VRLRTSRRGPERSLSEPLRRFLQHDGFVVIRESVMADVVLAREKGESCCGGRKSAVATI
jgi:hypothetical protein